MADNVRPTRKVTGASLGGALGVLVTYLLAQFHVSLPAEVTPAISTVLAFAGGWLVHELPGVRANTGDSADAANDRTPDVADGAS
jgi:hypothetical protein